jgi:hypothetical protein
VERGKGGRERKRGENAPPRSPPPFLFLSPPLVFAYLLRLELDVQVLPLPLQAHPHLVQQVIDLGEGGEEGVLGGQEVVDLERAGGGRRVGNKKSKGR